jgi:SAM-dependent methyltransferase
MEYTGDIAVTQQKLAETLDLQRRRLSVLESLALEAGEHVLEVGCGGGIFLPDLAAATQPGGRTVGVDISQDQISAAESRCAKLTGAEAMVADAADMPFDDAAFDAVVALQVIEYVSNPAATLAELRRVCRSGARIVILATLWDSLFVNSPTPELTAKIVAGWQNHTPHQNLPVDLRAMMTSAGFKLIHQTPVPILSNNWAEGSFIYWAARLWGAYVAGQGHITGEEHRTWLEGLEQASRDGTFFVSLMPVLTLGIAV